jgi:hypothetical protein
MQSLKNLAGVATLTSEEARSDMLSYPSHFQKTLGVEWKGSKTFKEACGNAEPRTVLLWLLEKSEDRDKSLNGGMIAAGKGGHESIVKLCKDWGVSNFNLAMACAAMGGHESMIKLCRDWGASLDSEMAGVAIAGNESIVRLCKDNGTTNFDETMAFAAAGGPIVQRLGSERL